MSEYNRIELDVDEYANHLQRDNRVGRCFICEIVRGEEPARPIIYRDELCVAFFPRWPRLVGYVLLAPTEPRTNVVGHFTEDEYSDLQRRVHRLGRAVTAVVPTDRLYIFSFGSNQGVAHLHWHIAPLPPGLPFGRQQFAAVDRADYLDIPAENLNDLAARIAEAIPR